MKVVNRLEVQHHEKRRQDLEEQVVEAKKVLKQHEARAPKAVTLKQHPEDSAPEEIAPGVFVVGGDYYHEGTKDQAPFAVAAHAVGEGKDWEPVK